MMWSWIRASTDLPFCISKTLPGWLIFRVDETPALSLLLQRLLHPQGEEESQSFSVAGGGVELHSGGKQS